MTFTRTPSSLFGIHRFFGVDVVVFCEGGQSISYAEAIRHATVRETHDTVYWRSVVSRLQIERSFHFKSVGCKSVIESIWADAVRLGLDNITVCRDSDYDRALGRLAAVGRIGCTMGYSWENDVFQLPVIEALALRVLGPGPDGTAAVQQIRAAIAQFERDLHRWVEVDISLYSRGLTGVFDKSKPLSVVDMSAPPTVRLDRLQEKLTTLGYKRMPNRVISLNLCQVMTHCFGKLVSRSIFHLFGRVVGAFSDLKFEYDTFVRLLIAEAFTLEAAGRLPEFTVHITSQRPAFV
jgi:hypothetical protein